MSQKLRNLTDEALIKFWLPSKLKLELQHLANARSLSLSALLRLIVTEYVKAKR
jgi:hypothetical protein